MKKNYVCVFMLFCGITLFAQEKKEESIELKTSELRDSIKLKSSELKDLKEQLNVLQNLRTELGGVLKNLKQKKDVDGKILSFKEEIIGKKVSLYELRTELPAKDPNSISVEINNISRQNKINIYKTLIKDSELKHKALENPDGSIKDSKLYEQYKKIIDDYKDAKKELLKDIKLDKVKIFEQAEKIQNEKLPFDLTLEEKLNINNNPFLAQKKDVNEKYKRLIINEKSKKAFANTKITYKATINNTNFTVPVARFNFGNEDDSEGNVVLFNSIGAGFGISWGKLDEIRNGSGEIVATDFRNTISIHGGVLFSASSGDNGNNVFAPVISLGLLDFQLGVGYELGTVTENQDNFFLTIGYAIPLYKLTKTKFYVRKKSRVLNEITTF